MADEIKEEPIPFLVYDQTTRKFTLTQQGEDVIKSFKNEFGVIAVAGMYRTGKSYLINRMLLNKQKGFSVGPTVNPCTKGLWIWSKPIFGENSKNKRLPILLIDTEGFGALDTDCNHDIRIFTLAILLSSYFLYNSVGGIDESALQNLNFVINLSKFIRLKNDQKETDPEELSNLFPSFLWVLRDFSLQLIDDNGENITPKEYLEKVLMGTKNINDPKNKIRKLIKAYFKDRDCFTMIRPLTNENQLQNLEDLPPEKLRPEFIEEIVALRKKVLSRVRVKTLNGKILNGDMYINLIKNLINALNSGKVPNIENTWLSMCKVESYKAFEEAEQIYENYLKENLDNTDDPLEEIHKQAKEKAISFFSNKALGDVANDYLKQLKNKMKEKYSYYNKVQDEEYKGKIIRILNKWYAILEQRIQSNEFKSIDEIAKDFISLEKKLNDTFPSYNSRQELFNEFKTKVFAFAGNYFTKKAESDKKYIQEQTEQKLKKLNDELSTMKMNYNKETNKKEIILKQNKTQISNLQDQLTGTKEELALLKKDKEISINNLNTQMTRIKEDYERKLKNLETKSGDNEQKQKLAEHKLITAKAQFDKEKALLSQKVDHLTKQIEDYSKREKEIKQEINSQLKEQSIAYKDKVDKYEKTIKNLDLENDALKEKIIDYESNLANLDNNFQNEKNKNAEIIEKITKENETLQQKYSTLKNSTSKEKQTIENNYKTKIDELNSKINSLKLKIEELEVKNKTLEDTSRNKITKLERELAIVKQENTLLKNQNDDINKRINSQKSYYENIITNLENKAFQVDHMEFQKKIEEIKSYYEDEKKKFETDKEKQIKNYVKQIEKLTDNFNKTSLNLKNTKDELEHLKTDSKNTINKITKEKEDLQIEKEKLNTTLTKNNEKMNLKLKSTLNDLEKKLEEKESAHQKEILQLNKSSEETLSQLKILFENEKSRLEEKLKEQKTKSDKKISELIEDYEKKIKELETDLKEENENLQNELNDLNQEHSEYVTNAEHEFELLNQKVENFEKNNNELKKNLNKLSSSNKQQVEILNENFNKERKELLLKIDNINNDLNNKDKNYTTLLAKKENLQNIINTKDEIINQLKLEYSKDKEENSQKYDELKNKYNSLNDGSMVKNLEYARENALLTQQIEYLTKKNDEVSKVIENNQKRYEENLFSLRAEVEKDFKEKFDRIKKEKSDVDNKLLSKKKEMKELEQTFAKQNQISQKEKNDLAEKLTNLQKKYDELVYNYSYEKNDNLKKINTLTKENTSFKSSQNSNETNYKSKINELATKLQEKTSQYEKDQILWENKIKFIEEQRDNLKKENNESSKRFEAMLDTIQKKNLMEKENIENNAKINIANLEQKYQKQLKTIQDNHNKLYTELLNNNKELEKDNKELRLENDSIKNKKVYASDYNKQLEEINKEKEKLKKSGEILKEESDKKIIELTNNFDKEKNNLKKKISDIEKNLREAEGKKGALLLELEKEKAKWNIEKDNLLTKYNELNDKMTSLEKKNELLLRENEKLKNEKNTLRRSALKKHEPKFSFSIGENKGGFGTYSTTEFKNEMLKVLGDCVSNSEEKEDNNNETTQSVKSKNKDEKKSVRSFKSLRGNK